MAKPERWAQCTPCVKFVSRIRKGGKNVFYKPKRHEAQIPNSGTCRLSMKRGPDDASAAAHTIPKLFYLRNAGLSSIFHKSLLLFYIFSTKNSQRLKGSGKRKKLIQKYCKLIIKNRKIIDKNRGFIGENI